MIARTIGTRNPVRTRLAAFVAAVSILGAGFTATAIAAAPASASQHASPLFKLSKTKVEFVRVRVGEISVKTFTITNTTGAPLTLNSMRFDRGTAGQFEAGSGCFKQHRPSTLQPGAKCTVGVLFAPRKAGLSRSTLFIDVSPGSPRTVPIEGTGTDGYFLARGIGTVVPFGDGSAHGGVPRSKLHRPIVAIRSTPSGTGYWLVASDGTVYHFGNASPFGSANGFSLSRPIVGMAATVPGNGYWLVGSDGGIFAFGRAPFLGSTGAMHLNQPIVGMAATPTGNGYWLVAADGGIFCFGDARFLGSTGAMHLNQPIVGMAATPTGKGYWLVAADGGVFTFGDAAFHGSAANFALGRVVGMAPTSDGGGYWMSTSFGAVYRFGDARFHGDQYPSRFFDGVGIAATAPLLRTSGSQFVFQPALAASYPSLAPLFESPVPGS